MTPEQRELCARLEAKLKGGVHNRIDSPGEPWIVHGRGFRAPALNPDDPADLWKWVELAHIQLQPLDNGTGTPHTWMANRSLIPVCPGYGDTPEAAVRAAVLALAQKMGDE